LLEGALIVVLVLVLFLGNLRAGLIVASVIPLSMLFAIIMMNTFGVSGNLMSLGALDFGLIVDGAVIIVEAILHHIHFSKRYAGISTITQEEMNKEVSGSAARMMNAAVFGQIIILIVYLPILSLQGIEGKMFKPMAQTVAFAILGAFILSITYVPMISSLFISKKIAHTPNFSDRVMMKLEKAYQRWLEKALQFRKSMVVTAVALLAIALVIFARMGGEFIPQLEEGDYAVETRLLVGTNLSTTIQSIEKISALLKKEYPEVEKVVSRIGSAEIPTDPMPIEGGDMIIVMKDKSEWKSAKSFQEMASKMAATVQEAIPGVSLGFQFPVQMRFNELMTGAKQDVVCKVYGEDLDQLARYATQVGEISRTVKGATDIYVEKVVGMPQVVIRYDRGEIARYGLSIDEINRTVNAAFAGAAAGQIYEGEKRFDLVVRVGSEGRKNLEDVRNLLISTPTGTQIPLYQLAAINEIEGPNQIQREDTRRRIIVGFNVRGRDVQSIVEELQQKIGQKVKFSPGYTITYGGAFENLQEAKKRLGVAVPVALLLIFVMLYFAFSSVKEGALIYTAIPLSAIGGVFALALRGMPFSISAGVGFIALFGVAVLNGIVLISEFNRIRDEGKITDIVQLVMEGTRNRLRPVLMTAAVASLGFLPMALSNGAGAEVQRPLATVVIGGLITATILTLFILPALYIMFNRKIRIKPAHIVPVSLLFFLSAQTTEAQETQKPLTMEQAVEMALKNNRQLQGARLNEAAVKKLQRTAFDVPKTQLSADYGQMNSINNDTRFGISQSISFPTVYTHQKKALRENYGVAQAQTQLSERDLRAAVRGAFTGLLWMEEKKKLLRYADSVYRLFERKSNLRFKTGETNILEKTTAETRRRQISIQLDMLSSDIDTALYTFNLLLQDSSLFRPQGDSLRMVFDADLPDTEKSRVKTAPQLELAQHQAEAARWRWKTEKARLLPELMLGYNNQSIAGSQIVNGQETFFGSGKRFTYVNAGIGIPLFFGAQSARISAARLEWQQQERQQEQVQRTLETQRRNILQEIRKYRSGLDYYDNDGLRSADQIIRTADQQFTGGEIDYLQWVILVDQAISIRNARLDMLNNYNQAVIRARKLYNL
ncbi:MAG: CusA/CzcA family heavy metal efflux RND transporter, partial [Mucilaginibacter polytrichastri]|nr:CusA/CzcA family heavy metal efflux RND transporter [Mucilaginibacter polytrichastri]